MEGNYGPSTSTDPTIIEAAQKQIKQKPNLFICGKCFIIFSCMEEFEKHTKEDACHDIIFENVDAVRDERLEAFLLWRLHNSQATISERCTTLTWYNNWCKINIKERKIWLELAKNPEMIFSQINTEIQDAYNAMQANINMEGPQCSKTDSPTTESPTESSTTESPTESSTTVLRQSDRIQAIERRNIVKDPQIASDNQICVYRKRRSRTKKIDKQKSTQENSEDSQFGEIAPTISPQGIRTALRRSPRSPHPFTSPITSGEKQYNITPKKRKNRPKGPGLLAANDSNETEININDQININKLIKIDFDGKGTLHFTGDYNIRK